MTDEIRAIGEECYIYRSSKTELVSADNKKRVSLSVTEYNILSFFIDNQDAPVSLEEIAQHIWGKNYRADEEVLSVNSLEACIANNRLISTGITWLTVATMLSQPVDSQAIIATYIDKTLSVARYLCSIEPIVSEISICISNAERLANYLDSIKRYDMDYLCKLESIANLIFSIVSEKKSEWINSISTIRRITLSHIQEETTYERYLLRAKRLGAAINPGVSAEMQNILKTGDIYAASKDPDGAYIMGSELAYYPEYFEPAVYYLQQSVENGDPHGLAALDLGELLEAQPIHKNYFSSLAHKYFRIATERGNHQYLSAMHRPQNRKSIFCVGNP